MSEQEQVPVRRWTVESTDVSGVPGISKPPALAFELSEDRSVLRATGPGGSIVITPLSDDAETSHLVLTNDLTGEVWAELVLRYNAAPSLGAEYNNALQYTCDIACALYWSMWRMQRYREHQRGYDANGAPV